MIVLSRTEVPNRIRSHAAIETRHQTQRGLDAAERRRLNALVTEALSPADALPAAEVDDTARREALVALRGWYEEWSTVARAEVKRRDHLILLGLARSAAAKTKAPPAP